MTLREADLLAVEDSCRHLTEQCKGRTPANAALEPPRTGGLTLEYMADSCIRLFDVAGQLGFDLGPAVASRLSGGSAE